MKKGFTLIELLVVIAILAILTTVVFVALNPAKRFEDARNSRRWNDVNSLLTAVHQCIVDEAGTETNCVGTLFDGTTYEIVNTGISSGCQTSCPLATADDSCAPLDVKLGSYLKQLPEDPEEGITTGHTEYAISVTNSLYTISSCSAEGGAVIEVSR